MLAINLVVEFAMKLAIEFLPVHVSDYVNDLS
jgi:hypothetical protein